MSSNRNSTIILTAFVIIKCPLGPHTSMFCHLASDSSRCLLAFILITLLTLLVRNCVALWNLDEFALLFGHLLTFLSSGVGHLAVFLILCLTMLFTLGNAHLLVSRVTFGLLMTLTFFVINHVGNVILISLALLTFLDRIVTREKLWNLPALRGGYITAGFLGYCQTLVLLDLLADLLWNLGALVLVHQLTLLLRHLLTLLAVKGGSLVGGLAVHRLADLLVLCPANRLFLKMTNIFVIYLALVFIDLFALLLVLSCALGLKLGSAFLLVLGDTDLMVHVSAATPT